MSYDDNLDYLDSLLIKLKDLINSTFNKQLVLSMSYSNYYNEEIVLVDFVDGEHIHVDVTDRDLVATVMKESIQRLSRKGYDW